MNKIIQGDCLEEMKNIPDKSIDMIIADLPYGTTDCKWDTIIPFDPMWKQLNRVIKLNGAIVLFGSEPFSSALRMSNINNYKYDWVWKKNTSAGFIHAKNRPLKKHELLSVFSLGSMGHKSQCGDRRMIYNPQGLKRKITIRKNGVSGTTIGKRPSHKDNNISEYSGYPNSILDFKNDRGFHPTQKPVALIEYMIKTYTNAGDIVLDNVAGSGTTGVACQNTNRKYILIEKDKKYIEIIKERLNIK